MLEQSILAWFGIFPPSNDRIRDRLILVSFSAFLSPPVLLHGALRKKRELSRESHLVVRNSALPHKREPIFKITLQESLFFLSVGSPTRESYIGLLSTRVPGYPFQFYKIVSKCLHRTPKPHSVFEEGKYY